MTKRPTMTPMSTLMELMGLMSLADPMKRVTTTKVQTTLESKAERRGRERSAQKVKRSSGLVMMMIRMVAVTSASVLGATLEKVILPAMDRARSVAVEEAAGGLIRAASVFKQAVTLMLMIFGRRGRVVVPEKARMML